MKNKNMMVECNRFILILLIMMHHLYVLGVSGKYLGASCWAWVDYFYIMTGYFTMAHFSKVVVTQKDSCGKCALDYTVCKFKKFMPYVVAAVGLQYLLNAVPLLLQHDVSGSIKAFADFPYEILLISSTNIIYPHVAPIWFLSAMLLTMPLLIFIMLKYRDIWSILSWLLPLLYVGKMGVNTSRAWPNDMIRAFVYMALGTFVYTLACKLKEIEYTNLLKIILTVVEVTSFLLCVYITVKNLVYMNLLFLLFTINTIIMFSGCSYTSKVRGKIFSFLGEISLPMFLFHWGIGCLSVLMTSNMSLRIAIYYLGTIIVSILAVCIKYGLSQKNRVVNLHGTNTENV